MGRLSGHVAPMSAGDDIFQNAVFKPFAVSKLKAGALIEYPVFDDQKTELLAGGSIILDAFIERLKRRKIETILVEETDIVRLNELHSCSLVSAEEQARPAICQCGQPLPLKLPAPGGPAVTWLCTTCGATYRTTVNPLCYSELADRVRPVLININRARLQHPSEEIAEFVTRLVEQPYRGPERRTTKRYPLCMPVPVLPVDEEFRPLGDPLVMMSRNISTGGIALIHTETVEQRFLILELAPRYGSPIQMVLEVLRCPPIGEFYEIAGKFLTRIDD